MSEPLHIELPVLIITPEDYPSMSVEFSGGWLIYNINGGLYSDVFYLSYWNFFRELAYASYVNSLSHYNATEIDFLDGVLVTGPLVSEVLVENWASISTEIGLLNQQGRVDEAWALLAANGDEYAIAAFAVTDPEGHSFLKNVTYGVWWTTVGISETTAKFDLVAQRHQENYITLLNEFGGRLPTSYGIEISYKQALNDFGISESAAIDLVLNSITLNPLVVNRVNLPEWYQLGESMGWLGQLFWDVNGPMAQLRPERATESFVMPSEIPSTYAELAGSAIWFSVIAYTAGQVERQQDIADAVWGAHQIVIDTTVSAWNWSRQQLELFWEEVDSRLDFSGGQPVAIDPLDEAAASAVDALLDIENDISALYALSVSSTNRRSLDEYQPYKNMMLAMNEYSTWPVIMEDIMDLDPVNERSDYKDGTLDPLGVEIGLMTHFDVDLQFLYS